MGTHPATAVLMNMRRSFPNIKHLLVIGIGGGMPFYGSEYQEQIVLGDVVVSVPQQREGGVVHYEFGAWGDEKEFKVKGHTLHPSSALLTAVNSLRMVHSTKPGTRIPQIIQQLREHLMDEELPEFQDPGSTNDYLFDDDYAHMNRNKSCEGLCNFQRLKQRGSRGSKASRTPDTPRIHYGNIDPSNALVISSDKKNRLYEQHGIICFEMEAAGIVSDQPALIVRGICDYADSHKNKRWQKYAAATAAACAKEILLLVPADSPEESGQTLSSPFSLP
jgi:nucleoside phosphorylase